MTLLFVYGTLKKGHGNHHYLADAFFVSEGILEGYRLYELGVPFVCYSGENCHHVYGEIYRVEDADMLRIDSLEGGYNKVYTDIKPLKDFIPLDSIKCAVYTMPPIKMDVTLIESGNY